MPARLASWNARARPDVSPRSAAVYRTCAGGAGREQVLGQVIGGQGRHWRPGRHHGVITPVGDHHHARPGRPLRIHHEPGVHAVAHESTVPVPARMSAHRAARRRPLRSRPRPATPRCSHRNPPPCMLTWPGYRCPSREEERRERPCRSSDHNDDNACHVVTTLVPLGPGLSYALLPAPDQASAIELNSFLGPAVAVLLADVNDHKIIMSGM